MIIDKLKKELLKAFFLKKEDSTILAKLIIGHAGKKIFFAENNVVKIGEKQVSFLFYENFNNTYSIETLHSLNLDKPEVKKLINEAKIKFLNDKVFLSQLIRLFSDCENDIIRVGINEIDDYSIFLKKLYNLIYDKKDLIYDMKRLNKSFSKEKEDLINAIFLLNLENDIEIKNILINDLTNEEIKINFLSSILASIDSYNIENIINFIVENKIISLKEIEEIIPYKNNINENAFILFEKKLIEKNFKKTKSSKIKKI